MSFLYIIYIYIWLCAWACHSGPVQCSRWCIWMGERDGAPESCARTAESDSYRVSSAVESLGRSNEHFDQHEPGPSIVERSGRAGASLQIASSTREAESDSYSVSSARATPTLSAAPGTAESDSYRVSSAVESLGQSNEHFDQHEQGPRMNCNHGCKVSARGRLLRAQQRAFRST